MSLENIAPADAREILETKGADTVGFRSYRMNTDPTVGRAARPHGR
jgi:hypothetical protein